MTPGDVGQLVQDLLEADGYEVESLHSQRIFTTDSMLVDGAVWKEGKRLVVSAAVNPERFNYPADVHFTDLASDDPFRGL